MSVLAHVFPVTGQRLGAAPSHLVFITSSLSGREVRNPEREGRRVRFNAASGLKKLSDWELLATWHAAHEGQTYGFLMKDWLDYRATQADHTIYNSGGLVVKTRGRSTEIPGAPGTYQLEKWYTVGSQTFKRKITRPVSGTVTLSTAGSLDYATGVVTGGGAAPDWTGEFYVPVRFEERELPQIDLTLIRPNGTYVIDFPEVPLIEDIE